MATPAIVGTGSALPANVRTNSDPVFDWLRANGAPSVFTGYNTRRVLGPFDAIADLMVDAANAALSAAGVGPGDVDVVLGSASFGRSLMPNDLAAMAVRLDVPPSTLIMPLNSEYAIFPQALVAAEGLLLSGRAKTALIVVGADWSRWVDYHTPQSASAGDGAGAVVMQLSDDPTKWRITDVAVASDWQYFGGMFAGPTPIVTPPPFQPTPAPTYFGATFQISDVGMEGFKAFGVPVPPRLVLEVATRNGVAPANLAVICHQTSTSLLGPWGTALGQAKLVETLADLGNMTSATIPVNLDQQAAAIASYDALALLALGPEPSCTVVLLERSAPV